MTETATAKESLSEFVSLTAGGQGFCVDIHTIREIRSWTPVTMLPFSEPSVLGIVSHLMV